MNALGRRYYDLCDGLARRARAARGAEPPEEAVAYARAIVAIAIIPIGGGFVLGLLAYAVHLIWLRVAS